MQYASLDPRARDPVGRLAWLRTITDEADMISRVLEQHARETARSDAALSAYLHRLAVCARDFVTNSTSAFASATPAVRQWVENN